MIVLLTDFGLEGPYIGQMEAVLHRFAPSIKVINLFADAPRFRPVAAGHLLAAYCDNFPADSVFLCVVDPGVGSDQSLPVFVEADGRWFVGPDNGLFDVVIARARQARCYEILWRPERLSASFHGRDLYAPVAAQLAVRKRPQHRDLPCDNRGGEELHELIYFDSYGNAMSGIRASTLAPSALLVVGEHTLTHANTFAEVEPGAGFWYENSNGLLEIAVNQGRAVEDLDLNVGDPIRLLT